MATPSQFDVIEALNCLLRAENQGRPSATVPFQDNGVTLQKVVVFWDCPVHGPNGKHRQEDRREFRVETWRHEPAEGTGGQKSFKGPSTCPGRPCYKTTMHEFLAPCSTSTQSPSILACFLAHGHGHLHASTASQPARDRASALRLTALRLTKLQLTDLRLTGLQVSALRLAALPRSIPQLAWLQLNTLQLTAMRKQVWLKVMAVLCRMRLELQRLNYWSKEHCVRRQRTKKISSPILPEGVHPSKVHEPEVILMMKMMIMMVIN